MSSIKEIAKLANVSPATVSKALNKRKDVSEATREKILKIAESQNFVPSAIGRNLKNRKTENIGVIVYRESQPLSGNPFYSRVLEGIEIELAINNYNLILHLLSTENNTALPKMLRERQIDGVILTCVVRPDFIERLKTLKITTVLIDPQVPVNGLSQVIIDNEYGAFEAVQYLINSGHQRIGFISGDLSRLSFSQRFNGYKKALKFHHIPFDKALVKVGGLEKGYDHVAKLLKMQNRPTAIFSANDINAIYGYKAIADEGFVIPNDISLVGFDDIELAKLVSPSLTTVRVYKEELGSIAVRMLLQSINEDLEKPITTLVPTKLVMRESVTTIKQAGNPV